MNIQTRLAATALALFLSACGNGGAPA
ncbi:cytochrome C, partial [Neisseria meningitidis]